MNAAEPVRTAREPRVMDRAIVWEQEGTIVSVTDLRATARLSEGEWVMLPIDRLRWTGTAWVIVPEDVA